MAATNTRRNTSFWIIILILVFILGFSLMLNLTALRLLSRNMPEKMTGDGEDEFPQFTEIHSQGSGGPKAVRIAFSGILTHQDNSSWLGMMDPVDSLLRQIRAARQDPDVTAILLEVDSPGGGVTAADEVYQELMLFKKSREDRILTVLVQDMAASGGYYISLPADRIIAQPTAIVGSIGVLIQSLNISDLSQKIGIADTTIKSGKNKDMLNPFQPVNEEQVELLQQTVDAMYDRFLSLVEQHRPIQKNDLKKLADGRIFTARQALNHKLVDGIGYWDDAVNQTAKLAGADDLLIVRYETKRSFLESLMGVRFTPPGLQSLLTGSATPRRLFLWRP